MKKIGKYEILGVLGKGGMGIVYKALDPDIEREVAIKTIRFDTIIEGAGKDEMMARFIREAKAAGRLTHPNIITIYDVSREKDTTYIVMQYVEGQSLQGLTDSGKKYSPQEIIDLLKPIADCLDYAHRNSIVHRDIKPANILIDKSGKPFLADFGVARIETSTMTQSGTSIGTLSYMSPEQVKGETADSRSDIFALGVILYELLAGEKPFVGDNLSTIVYKIVHEEPQRVTEINKDLPQGYEIVVRKALAKNPDARYKTCREMIADLESPGLDLEQTLALEAEKEDLPAAAVKKKRWLPLTAVSLGLGVVAVSAYLILSSGSEKPSSPSQSILDLKKEDISSVTRSGSTPEALLPAPDDSLQKLQANFDLKNYEEVEALAEEILTKNPTDETAQEYLKKAKAEQLAAQVAPILQSGIANFSSGNFSQCILDMEKVLKLDKDNEEAKKYLFQADTALAKKDISQLVELYRIAEENKDLLAVLSFIDSPSLRSQLQSEYMLLFNGYDEIKSIISNLSMSFSSRWDATARFDHLLTAVYKKDGRRKIVFEGTKKWQLKKQGKSWKITGVQ